MARLYSIETASENSYIIYFGEPNSMLISANLSEEIASTTAQIKHLLGANLLDLVPSYASLLVIFNGASCDHLWVKEQLRRVLTSPLQTQKETSKLVKLPVFYSTEYGPELSLLAANANLTVEQTINLHCATEYLVYAIGFAPGFAYLGELDERLAAPRLATPRLKVPAGSVAIADRQTAVYPAASPGGWNLIGLCPTPMFNSQQIPHMPVSVGDRIQFYPIDQAQYVKLGGQLHEF